MKKKSISVIAFGAMFALAACTPSAPAGKAEPWNGILINDGNPITLIVDLNGLMPTTNTEATEQSPIVFNSIRDITSPSNGHMPKRVRGTGRSG